jgi:hypothetical protein
MTIDNELEEAAYEMETSLFDEDSHPDLLREAANHIRAQAARIAALTKDAEPVAWRVEELQAQNQWFTEDESDLGTVDCQSANIVVTPLYTHPPAPELKPLSLDEIHQRYKNLRVNEPPHYIDIYRDAEAALGILRGGL